MSHVATIEIQIDDLEALAQACKECGLILNLGQKTYRWYGTWVNDYHGNNAAYKHGIDPKDYGKCDHAISVPGNSHAYEIGVVKKDNKYVLIWDFYAGGKGLLNKAGQNCSKLVQSYAKTKVLKQFSKMGYSCAVKQNANGTITVNAFSK